jgi:Fe-S-cluster containining protein
MSEPTKTESLTELLESLDVSRICKDECHAGCCKRPNILPLVEKGQKERLERMAVEIKTLVPEDNSVSRHHESYSALEITERGCSQVENDVCKVYENRPIMCRLFPARPEIFLNLNGSISENRRKKISEIRGIEKRDYQRIHMINYYSEGKILMVPGLTLSDCLLGERMSDEQRAKYLMSCVDVLLQERNLKVYGLLILSNLRTYMSVLKDEGNYNDGIFPTLEERMFTREILGYKVIEGYKMTPDGVKVLS